MGVGACNRKSNLAELKWKKKEKLGQEEVKVGSDWQFLCSALATCLMPHGPRQPAECVVATLRQLPQLTGLISTHTHTLRHTAIFVSHNSAVKSNAPLCPFLSCQGCQPFGLPITVMIAAHTHTHTHAETIRNNFTAGPNRKRKGTKSKRKYRKERKFTDEKPKVLYPSLTFANYYMYLIILYVFNIMQICLKFVIKCNFLYKNTY